MRTFILLFGLTLLTSTVGFCQHASDDLTTEFFRKYKSNTDEAFDFIFGTNKWIGENNEGALKVKFQLREYASLMGEYIGFEKVADKSIGESLIVSIYLVKYERQPLWFMFKYYIGKDKWTLYNLKFDENLGDALDEIIKYDYLKGD